MISMKTKRTDPVQIRRTWATGFKASSRGNAFRRWCEMRLTVFPDSDGGYRWCIATDDEGATYAPASLPTEADAIDALADLLEIGLSDY